MRFVYTILSLLLLAGSAFGQEPKPKAWLTGAKPTPAAKILASPRFVATRAALEKVAYIPAKLDPWGNNQYGVCVSSEEAFNQDVSGTFIEASIVIAWARKNGWLNGAYLTEVMDEMQTNGFVQGGKTYGIGNYAAVDYSRETELKNALSIAPVKIAMASSALPSGAGSVNGWYALGGRHRNTDHCVALCGYGPAGWLCEKLKVQLPSALKTDQPMYLLFTWGTIGLVDHAWIMGTCVEAWVRNPSTTINGQPQPNPGPTPTPPDPGPGPGPGPGPNPPSSNAWVIDPVAKELSIPTGWKVINATPIGDHIDLTNISAKNAAILKLLADSMREKPAEPPKKTAPKIAPKATPKASNDIAPLPIHFAFADLNVPIKAPAPETPEPPIPYTPPDPPAPEKEPTKAERIYAKAVKEERFLLWLGEAPCFSCSSWPTRATFTITISGPWHNGKHITYATLPTPTQFEVETALAKARAAWEAERQVKPIQADPFAQPAAEAAQQELPVGGAEVLEMVNRQRAARGLRPFVYDPQLTTAAIGAARARAQRLLFGHLPNDFVYLPSGCYADAAGCAAYPESYGFMACCVYDNYTYAGAAWVKGSDGKMYCHIFVKR